MAVDRRGKALGEAGITQVGGGQVDRHSERVSVGAPLRQLGERQLGDPLGELGVEDRAVDMGEEVVGASEVIAVTHSNKRLDRMAATVGWGDLRLIDEHDPVVGERAPDRAAHPPAAGNPAEHEALRRPRSERKRHQPKHQCRAEQHEVDPRLQPGRARLDRLERQADLKHAKHPAMSVAQRLKRVEHSPAAIP
jgi:hypothetical protein